VHDFSRETGYSNKGKMRLMPTSATSFSREELEAWASQHVGFFRLDLKRVSSQVGFIIGFDRRWLMKGSFVEIHELQLPVIWRRSA